MVYNRFSGSSLKNFAASYISEQIVPSPRRFNPFLSGIYATETERERVREALHRRDSTPSMRAEEYAGSREYLLFIIQGGCSLIISRGILIHFKAFFLYLEDYTKMKL
jgi:hypothetical protein